MGNNLTLAPNVHILAHDASIFNYLGYTKIGNVTIGNNVFIGASSLGLPNLHIRDNCIIGANTTVTKNIPYGSNAVGNPAKMVGRTEDYVKKNKELLKKGLNLKKNIRLDKKLTMS